MDDAEAPDRSRPGDLSPIWRMLVPGQSASGDSATPLVVALSGLEQPWAAALSERLNGSRGPGGTAIIVLDRPWSGALLSLLAHGRWRMTRAPSLRRVRRELQERAGAELLATYVLWPSARTPRIAFPRGKRRLVTWAQRSGVLGGGGNRLWARRLARSMFFTPIAALLAPGLALVVRLQEESRA